MTPLRFAFNWIAILTLPVWGWVFLGYQLVAYRQEEDTRAVFTGRKWIGEL